MLLPNFIYGRYQQVKKRCKKLGKAGTTCHDYVEMMLSMGMRDTAADAGDLLVLEGPSPLLSKVAGYQLYVPLSGVWHNHVYENTSLQLLDDIFDDSLKTPWGTLCLTHPTCWNWLETDDRRRAYLRAVFAHWEEINAVGPRYSDGRPRGEPLLEQHSMIQWSIGNLLRMTNAEGARTDWTAFFYELKSKGLPDPSAGAADTRK